MGEVLPMNDDVKAAAEAEEASTKGCNYDLYNRINALLPLFGLTEIPLFNTRRSRRDVGTIEHTGSHDCRAP